MQHVSVDTAAPWWRYGHVWLVISGPVVVVLAGLVTVYLALSRPEHLVAEDYYQQGLNINQARELDARMQPAMAGRNHAATGGAPGARASAPATRP